MPQRDRVNDMIRISPLRVIGPDNEQYGVISLDEAKRLAEEAGLDLVEVAADSRPPVCRIMDYGRYKYEKSKKEQKARAGSKKSALKEVRLGRSLKIDPHDVLMRVNQARQFLIDGHKVQFIQPYRGRENQHKQPGIVRLNEIAESIDDIAKVEVPPKIAGRFAMMIVAPDKVKVQNYLRQQEKKEKKKADDKKDESDSDGGPTKDGDPADTAKDDAKAKENTPETESASTTS